MVVPCASPQILLKPRTSGWFNCRHRALRVLLDTVGFNQCRFYHALGSVYHSVLAWSHPEVVDSGQPTYESRRYRVSPVLIEVCRHPLPSQPAHTPYQVDGTVHESGTACALGQEYTRKICPRLQELDRPYLLEHASPPAHPLLPCADYLHQMTDASFLDSRT